VEIIGWRRISHYYPYFCIEWENITSQMKFSEVVGQKKVKDNIRSMIIQHKVPHAVLLLGSSGVGALPLAIAMAHAMVCPSPVQGEACGACPSCNRSFKYLHPDVHFAFPTTGKDVTSDNLLPVWRNLLMKKHYFTKDIWINEIAADNKQANINKEECFNIRRKLSLKCAEAEVRVMIIWLPEYLGKEGNRLLKILEEPPPDTHFILVAEQSDQILQTIMSRCQLIKVPLLTDEVLDKTLKSIYPSVTDLQLNTVIQLANGSFSEAIALMAEQEDLNAGILIDWMRKCYKGNGLEMSRWVDEISVWTKEKQKIFIRYSLHFFRGLLVLPILGQEKSNIPKEMIATSEKLRAILTDKQLEQMTHLADENFAHLERNANPKILFLDLSIKFHQIMQNKFFNV
jgi:DNA polymerase-3 subunit delta'